MYEWTINIEKIENVYDKSTEIQIIKAADLF